MELADPLGGYARFCVDLTAEFSPGNGGHGNPRMEPFGRRAPLGNAAGYITGHFAERATWDAIGHAAGRAFGH